MAARVRPRLRTRRSPRRSIRSGSRCKTAISPARSRRCRRFSRPNKLAAITITAIIAADVAGYSRLISLDETRTVQTLSAYRAIFDALIAEHGGRIANTAGDSVLAEFASALDAVECCISIQLRLGRETAGLSEDL